MLKNRVKKALQSRKVSLGGWMQIGHPAGAEVMAGVGLDWIAVDMEHGGIDLETTINILRAIQAKGCLPIARVPANDAIMIRRVLDAGAMGVIVPMVNTRADAEKAVAAVRYPPEGQRGFGFCRANNHGMNFDEYVKSANDEIAVVAQIEHRQGVENIEAILHVKGIDGVFVGPYDLSGSFGLPGQLRHAKVQNALAKVLRSCEKNAKSAGMHVVQPSAAGVKAALRRGFTFIAISIDTLLIASGLRNILRDISGPISKSA